MTVPILSVYDAQGNEIAIPAIKGEKGADGAPGQDGADGITPNIGENGHWFYGDTDSGKPSRGAQGIQGPPGQDGSDAEVTEENIVSALGYTPADEDDLSGKLDTTGGTMTGGLKFSFNGAYVSLNNTPVVAVFSAEVDIGHQNRPLMLRGSANRPQYKKGSEDPEDMALLADLNGKADKPAVKTTMDSVAVPNAKYFLGEQSAVALVLPSPSTPAAAGDPEPGMEISCVFYSGATATTLTVTGDVLGTVPTPATNQRVEINALFDGVYWSIVSKTDTVPVEEE